MVRLRVLHRGDQRVREPGAEPPQAAQGKEEIGSPGRTVIPHLDDVGCARGSIAAFEELTRSGLVTCGSAIVPSPLFREVATLAARRSDLDLGVHLALTSESESMRWGPVSREIPTGELTDADGFFPPDADRARRSDPAAVERELIAQVERALAAGLAVSHLDHHMGVTATPEFIDIVVRLARRYRLPVVLPADLEGYFSDLRVGPADPGPVRVARRRLEAEGLLVADHFRIGYVHQQEPCREVYERFITQSAPGTTFLSLHCSAPGDIARVHPRSAAWRVAEYELFGDPGFRRWVSAQGVEVAGIG